MSYDWIQERESISFDEQEVNEVLQDRDLRVKSYHWLKNPEGQWYVNKVFKVCCEKLSDPSQTTTVVVKISHPFWNSTGKLTNEARALQYVKKHTTIPVPEVLGVYTQPMLPADIILFHREEYLLESRQKQPNPKREFMIMSFLEGECLGEFWETLSWEERKPYIDSMVDNFAQLHKLKGKGAGVLADVESAEIMPQIFDTYDGVTGVFRYWGEQLTQQIQAFISKIPSFKNERLNNLDLETKLMHLVETQIRKEEYKNIPIVFSVNDIAPKNTLVDTKTKTVVGIVDWEWASFNFEGVDVSEMIYPLKDDETSNESVTDSKDVSFEEQRDYVLNSWKGHGIAPADLEKRDKLSKLGTILQEFYTTKFLSEQVEKLQAHLILLER